MCAVLGMTAHSVTTMRRNSNATILTVPLCVCGLWCEATPRLGPNRNRFTAEMPTSTVRRRRSGRRMYQQQLLRYQNRMRTSTSTTKRPADVDHRRNETGSKIRIGRSLVFAFCLAPCTPNDDDDCVTKYAPATVTGAVRWAPLSRRSLSPASQKWGWGPRLLFSSPYSYSYPSYFTTFSSSVSFSSFLRFRFRSFSFFWFWLFLFYPYVFFFFFFFYFFFFSYFFFFFFFFFFRSFSCLGPVPFFF